MKFIEAYKRLEKLCGDMYGDDKKITGYIERMEKNYNGEYYVDGWNEDLKKLKHYRWIRNKISHEPNCSEDDYCSNEDVEWLDDFYARIMNQTDPLALYAKKIRGRQTYVSKQITKSSYSGSPSKSKEKEGSLNVALIFIVILVISIFLIYMFI